MNNIINIIEKKYKKIKHPNFKSGDTIEVKIWIFEGPKKRIQSFEGIVISIKNKGLGSSFTIRKISHNEGVERLFKKYSPIIKKIKIKKRGIVHKSKLYFLRKKLGKLIKIKEKLKKIKK